MYSKFPFSQLNNEIIKIAKFIEHYYVPATLLNIL